MFMKKSVLCLKADELAQEIYRISDNFPRNEMYGLTSQIRRSAISVPANIIEGFARRRVKVYINHLGIAYGSLAETKYYLKFSYRRKYISKEEFIEVGQKAEEMSKLLWTSLMTLRKNRDNNLTLDS